MSGLRAVGARHHGPRRATKADELLLLHLAQGYDATTAAMKAGVSRRTAVRRLADPEFKLRLHAMRGEMVSRATGVLAAGAVAAAGTLLELLKAQSETTRLMAATRLLESCVRYREAGELEERLTALEAQTGSTRRFG